MAAKAEDTLRLAIGQQGNWETAIADIGSRAGIFKKHGLNLESTCTKGAGEIIQTVISGTVDIGVGTTGVMSAFAKGAPVRVIGSATVGSDDLYWFVKADNPLKSIRDAADGANSAWLVADNMLYTVDLATGMAKSWGKVEGASGMIRDITALPKI